MNDNDNNPCARENYSLQHSILSIHLDHFGDEDREIPPFEFQLLIPPARHGKSARLKVIQGDGSGESRADQMT